ncbi:hypothetical protein AvCA_35430 [Azotobacter vinelandii CA]|uniref:Uncharacterized protein n=2 Tax=Azotobacter vinelandii TaxID=354 RepID=C1DR34_AZOVD|nr:hypothetical protein Avin_35430 [Azotobacter vinelandii DJ]AGK14604.1 hypothetical protein AvCA_35430 [Azotobacter vinelandii CA]AGK21420.1 hypothetical protein AvCA6_35430 [Azotobacter vinelandii CA6]
MLAGGGQAALQRQKLDADGGRDGQNGADGLSSGESGVGNRGCGNGGQKKSPRK